MLGALSEGLNLIDLEVSRAELSGEWALRRLEEELERLRPRELLCWSAAPLCEMAQVAQPGWRPTDLSRARHISKVPRLWTWDGSLL